MDKLNYDVSYQQCSSSAEQIYEQAGTRDADVAARWLVTGVLQPGPHWEGGYHGCLDALRGEPSRF
jgi:hypothetical protein